MNNLIDKISIDNKNSYHYYIRKFINEVRMFVCICNAVKESQIKTMFTSDNFRFASSVALFGMLLRDSKYSNSKSYSDVLKIATASMGLDSEGYRKEFIEMVKSASLLASK